MTRVSSLPSPVTQCPGNAPALAEQAPSDADADGRAVALARAVGFTSLAFGVGSGLVLGLWSFGGPVAVPDVLGDYAALPRRLARLGHIAFVGLGLIGLCLAGHVGAWKLPRRAKRAALWLMIFGNVALPFALFTVAFRAELLPLLAPPALAVFAALIIAASGAWRQLSHADPTARRMP